MINMCRTLWKECWLMYSSLNRKCVGCRFIRYHCITFVKHGDKNDEKTKKHYWTSLIALLFYFKIPYGNTAAIAAITTPSTTATSHHKFCGRFFSTIDEDENSLTICCKYIQYPSNAYKRLASLKK